MAHLGYKEPTTPLASPYYAGLRGWPPLMVQVGLSEVLLDNLVKFDERAKAAGVDVTLQVWDDIPRIWQAFASFLPEGPQAIEHCGNFIRKHIPERKSQREIVATLGATNEQRKTADRPGPPEAVRAYLGFCAPGIGANPRVRSRDDPRRF